MSRIQQAVIVSAVWVGGLRIGGGEALAIIVEQMS